jgi:TonB family protein
LSFLTQMGMGPRRNRRTLKLAFLMACSIFFGVLAWSDDAPGKKDEASEEQVYALNDDIVPPRIIRRVNPQYSPGSHGIKVEGSVVVETVVSSQGSPRRVRVVKSLDKDVDGAAVEAVKQWVFAPGKKDGKAVAVRLQIEIHFHSM